MKRSIRALLIAGLLGVTQAATVRADESGDNAIDDATITARVKGRLMEEQTVSELHISVETRKGIVHLSGLANSAEEKTRAGEMARGVPDVGDVQNEIIVKNAPSAGD